MPIYQRCPACNRRASLKRATCICGEILRAPRRIAFRKQIDGKIHHRDVGRISLADARILYAEWITEISAPTIPPESILTIRQMCDAHIVRMQVNGKSYWKKAQLFFDRLVDFCAENKVERALDLTSSILTAWQTDLRQQGASPAYCDRHLRMVGAAWNTSLRHHHNPVSEVTLYHPDNSLTRFLSPEEEEALLAAAREYQTRKRQGRRNPRGACYVYEILLVALYTGMRETNVLHLHTDETDFDAGIITVTQKNNLPLVVEMHSRVRDALLAIKPTSPGYYFVNPRTGKPYNKLVGTWALLKKAAGITRPFRFHDLRHTFGTNLGEITGNPRLVMEALGHRNIETTMRYFHVRRDRLRAGIEKLGNHDFGKVPKTVPKKGSADITYNDD